MGACASGLLTVGFYFGVSAIPHITLDYLTQVEGLVGFPMYLCVWYACKAAEGKGSLSRNLLLSGLMGGLVLMLKLMFLPMVLSFWVASYLYSLRGRRDFVLHTLRSVALVGVGVAVPILLVIAYFWQRDGLSYLWYATFTWPSRAVGKLPLAGIGRLHEGLNYFVDGFAPLLALGFLGAWSSLRRRWDILTINLVLWLVTGMVSILIQLRSWWPHHYLLLFVPLGILATQGVEFLYDQLRAPGTPSLPLSRSVPFAVALVLLFAPVIYPTVADALLLARYRFALSPQRELAYQCRFPHNQYLTSDELGFLSEPGSLPGPIYVAGTSMYYYLSGRMPAVPMCAAVNDFLPDQWRSFEKALSAARPPYIFVEFADQDLFDDNSPETNRFISENYRLLRKDRTGIWYVLASPDNRERLDEQISFRTPSPGCPAREETRAH